tara:strand:- start:99 stop:515 length:417 start_codon:yes stop_codon:yes gene_type:complete
MSETPIGSTKEPKPKSRRKINTDSINRSKLNSQKELPWWVELFFVQLGLPDYLLRYLLRKRKNLSVFIEDNSTPLKYSILFILTLAYIYPIIKQASLFNKCVESSQTYLTKEYRNKIKDPDFIIPIATRYCNGGDLSD